MATREGQARRDKVVELPGGFWLWMRKALDLEKHSTSTQLVPRQKWPPTVPTVHRSHQRHKCPRVLREDQREEG